jgi:EmrB/QacA subfamily drug resistance transporter
MILASVLLGTFVGAVNNSVANVAVLEVVDEFDLDVSAAVWFVSGYVLAFAALMPAVGQLASRRGPRPVYLTSLGVFAAASALVAVAPNYLLVVAARVVQGVAAAPVLPVVMMTVVAAFPAGGRGRAMGLWASMNGAAVAVGPALGGVVTETLGWRAIFWLDIPLALTALALAAVVLPRTTSVAETGVDVTGAVLLSAGLVAVLFGLSAVPSADWTGLLRGAALGIGALQLVVFWRRSRRLADDIEPVVAVSVLRDRHFCALSVIAGFQMAVLAAVLLATPLVLVSVFEQSVTEAGGLTVVLPLSMMLAGPVCGHLTDRIGAAVLAWHGGLVLVAASLVLASAVGSSSLPLLLVGLLVAGVGIAMIQSPVAVSVAEHVDDADRGAAMGVFHAARFAGAVVGASAAAATVTAVAGGALEVVSRGTVERAFLAAFLVTGLLGVVVAAVARHVGGPTRQTRATGAHAAISRVDPTSPPLIPSTTGRERERRGVVATGTMDRNGAGSLESDVESESDIGTR